VVDLVTMVANRERDRSHLVRLLAADPQWPLAGTLALSGRYGPVAIDDLATDPVCAVQGDLLVYFDIAIGDAIRIGDETFTVIARIEDLPGLAFGGFAIGSRVLIHPDQLAATGLVEYGSRVRYREYLSVADETALESAVEALITRWDLPRDARDGMRARRGGGEEARIRIRNFRDAQDQVRAVFDRLSGFLRLVALCGLLLAGVGIAAVTRSHVAEQVESIAVLQVLGASGRRVALMTAWQIALIAALGSLLGAVLGSAAQMLTVAFAGEYLPVDLAIGVDWPAVAWGLVLGVTMALISAAAPVLSVVDVSPAAVLRREPPPRTRWPHLAAVGLIALVALVALAAWEADGWLAGVVFMGVLLAASLAVLLGGAAVLAGLAALAPLVPGFALRQGLRALWRAGRRPLPAVVAIGVAATLLGAILVQRASIAGELDPLRRGSVASLFVINLAREDHAAVRRVAAEHGGSVEFAPMVRARLSAVNGEPVRSEATGGDADERRRRNFKRREQNLSWRQRPHPEDEHVVAGAWMDAQQEYDLDEVAEASLEVDFAEDIGVGLGDVLRFDIQGVPVEVEVTSLRAIDWTSFRPNFFILISPGLLGGEAGVPADWVAGIELPEQDRRHAVQAAVVRELPQASVFDVALTVAKVRQLVDHALLAVGVLALFALAAGLVVLAGIVAADARRRREEAALLRVLGADDRTLIGALAVEFASVGLIAGVIGSALALGVAWLLQQAWSDLPFVVPWIGCLALAGGVALLTLGVGLASCRRVWRLAPLAVLRES